MAERPAAPPRVVLVEDDAALRRFVEMALDGLAIDLRPCTRVAEAWPLLRSGGWQLLVTDLMLPGESGLELIQRLAATPAAGGGRIVVFSAGVMPALRAQLATLGVWRVLDKPVSVAALASCVRDALGLAPPPGTSAPDGGGAGTDADEQHVIALRFGGDATLFRAYRASCLALFPADLAAGDAALAAGDAQALRRLAHNLKSVLETLGHPAPALVARQLETACEGAPGAQAAAPLWQDLRRAVETLTRG